MGKFVNVRTKVKHKCLKCNNEFDSCPKTVKSSIYGCPYCAGVRVSGVDYVNKLPSDIKLVGEYKNCYTKTEHKCLVCMKNWSTKPYYITSRECGCPYCSSSKGERMINSILTNIRLPFISESSININGKFYYFDFFVPDLKLAIEFDGIQHFESVEYFGGSDNFNINILNDKIKEEYCVQNNIFLLRIPYYDIDLIELLILEKIGHISAKLDA